MEYEQILFEMKDKIATITLNRPEKLNAITFQMYQEIHDTVLRIEEDQDVRVMILKGAGRAFSCGHDVNEMYTPYESTTSTTDTSGKWAIYPANTLGLRNFEMKKYMKPKWAIRELKVPTIAQIHGWCVVGGWMLTNEFDLVVASEDTKIANWTARFGPVLLEGFPDPWNMSSWRKLKEFFYTGNPISAEEAYRLGTINRVVPLEKLEEETLKLANEIVMINPGTTQLNKQVMNMVQDIQGYTATQKAVLGWHWLGHHADWHMGQGGVRERYTKEGVRAWIRDLHSDRTSVWPLEENK